MRWSSGACVVAVLATLSMPGEARAQAYLPEDAAEAYAALDPGEGTTLFSASDDGFVEVTLPFTFRLYGRAYSTVWVSVNGAVSFVARDEVTSQVSVLSGQNEALPSSVRPQAVIAAAWDDWVVSPDAPGGARVAWAVREVEGKRRMIIDWQRVQPFAASGPEAPAFSFQLVLFETSDQYAVRFGPTAGTGQPATSATSGLENHQGAIGLEHFGCSPSCEVSDLLPGTGVLVSPNLNPELEASIAVVGAVSGGPRAEIHITNNGPTIARDVVFKVLLSADAERSEPDDATVYTHAEPFDIPAGPSSVTLPVDITIDPTLLGRHHLIVVVDPDDAVPEVNKRNNVAASLPFVAGAELEVVMTTRPEAIVGESTSVNIELSNVGVRDASNVVFHLVLESALLDEPMVLYASDPVDLPALTTTFTSSLPVPVPRTLLGGSYELHVELDPGDVVPEVDESNNVGGWQAVELLGPDVTILSIVAGADSAFQGLTLPVRVALENKGLARAEGFTFSVYLSPNDTITLRDRLVYTSQPFTLEGLATRIILEAARIGTEVPPGDYYVGVIVDAQGAVLDMDRSNNVRRSDVPVTVTPPVPDLGVSDVATVTAAPAGETVPVSAIVSNLGAASADFEWTVVLSSNPLVSASDRRLATGQLNMSPGTQQSLSVDVLLPPLLSTGDYTLGVVLDPLDEVAEADETNNHGASARPLSVSPAALSVVTASLPEAVLGMAYSSALRAVGGTGEVSWRLAGGELPEGLSLSASGHLTGTPTSPGLHVLIVEVASAGATAMATFGLSVRDFASSLGIVDSRLPAARRGVAYEQRIGAVGGTPPYAFNLTSEVPPGLAFDADGTVSGFALEEGSYELHVELTDAAGHRKSGVVALDVITEGALSLVLNRLRDAEAGRPYAQPLSIEGGLAPYTLEVLEGTLPDGLSLSLEDDGASAAITGLPQRVGVWSFTLLLSDSRGERDLGHVVMKVSPRELTFIDLTLPASSPGATYSYAFETNARPPAVFAFVGGELPPGLTLDADGTLSGTVAEDAPRRVYGFAVSVTDPAGGVGLGVFSIDLPAPARVKPATDEGCASTGATSWSLLALVVFSMLRRSRRSLTAVLAVAISLSATDAFAFYRLERETAPFVPLVGGTTLSDPTSADRLDQSSPVSLPFAFTFYGRPQTTIGVGVNGLLTFGSVNKSASNTALPSAGEPSNFIAPFWDDLQLSHNTPNGASRIAYSVEGDSPDRVLVVEWRNLQREAAHQSGVGWEAYSFQVRLHEGTNEFSIHTAVHATSTTGRPQLSGTSGVENDTGTLAIDMSDQRCSPACGFGSIVQNRLVRFVPSADLRIESISAPTTLYAGTSITLRASLHNDGGAAAAMTRVSYVLSTDTLPGPDDLELAVSTPVSVGASSSSIVSTRLTVDPSLPPGLYQLLAHVSTSDPEVSVENNRGEPVQVVLAPAAPDFRATRLLGTPTSHPGAAYALTRTIQNAGNEQGDGTFKLVLSSNAHASSADLELASGTFSLAAGESLDVTESVQLPPSLAPGRYWFGLLVRPVEGVPELDSLNNQRVLGPVAILGGPLSIVETTLPDVVAGVGFAIDLHAVGGAGEYVWSAGDPPLPEGVSLSAAGTLSGVVDATGEHPFRIVVSSAGAIVSHAFTLRAVRERVPVAVVSGRLPVGTLGAAYEARLVARGGTPPYFWAAAGNSAPPSGLSLAPDGTLEGRPFVDGDAPFSVLVTDAAGGTASGELVVPVAGPVRPMFATRSLPPALLGEAWDEQLLAAGGTPPYRFSIVESRRLATGLGDLATSLIGAMPEGLTLSEAGQVSGVPVEAGLFALSLRLVDEQGYEDAATYALVVRADSTLSIRTASLPDGTVGERYEARLQVTGATGQVTWEAQLLEDLALPGGLSLSPDGRLTGLPLTTGHAGFLAIARDEAGLFAVQPLAVRVVAAPRESTKTGGCAQAGSMGLLTLLALLVLARRRRPGKGVGLAAAVVLLGLTACSKAPSSPCDETCANGFVCDPLDGLCKCGEAGGAVCVTGETCDVASRSCLVATCATSCPAGSACGDDGACHCGSPTGPTCAQGESCGDLGRCEPVDPCAEVVCAAGMTCDPSAQGECRCGAAGASCSSGERCVDSTCVPDLCLGVACTGGTSCDPEDGLCRCGGAGGSLCLSGEACDATRGVCERSNTCAGVTCAAGSACDLADATCKCGGAGGPVCSPDQTCDPLGRVCGGGDLCRTVVCVNGSSCDAEDGQCKCGGLDGVVCASDELCVATAARYACERPCVMGAGDCGAGFTCRFEAAAATTICKPEGDAPRGGDCGDDDPCQAGLHCVASDTFSRGRCHEYCVTSDVCAAGVSCQPFLPDDALGACIPEEQ